MRKKEIKTHHKTALEMLQYECGHIFIDRGIEQHYSSLALSKYPQCYMT